MTSGGPFRPKTFYDSMNLGRGLRAFLPLGFWAADGMDLGGVQNLCEPLSADLLLPWRGGGGPWGPPCPCQALGREGMPGRRREP